MPAEITEAEEKRKINDFLMAETVNAKRTINTSEMSATPFILYKGETEETDEGIDEQEDWK